MVQAMIRLVINVLLIWHFLVSYQQKYHSDGLIYPLVSLRTVWSAIS